MKFKETALNILLADDDPDDRLFFEKALQEIPLITNLIMVNNGEELMDYLLLIHHLPDIIFLDLSMPRKTGYECLLEIKDNDILKNIPVVMFSTSFDRQHINLEYTLIDTLSKMGAQDYIRKPGDFEKLKQVIHQTLINLIEKKNLNNIKNN